MATIPGKTHLSLLSLFSLTILVQAKLISLQHSDYEALSIVLRDLGLNIPDMASPCNTAGVFCERRISKNSPVLRVTRLVFNSQQLTGFLSPAIRRLTELKELSLSNNQLIHQIPPQIVACRKLEILSLQNNSFTGEVPPEISSLVRLQVLDLSSNKFSAKVRISTSSFRNLRHFNISGNSLLEDHVPRRYIFAENNSTTNGTATKTPPKSHNTSANIAPAPAPIATPEDHNHKHKKTGIMILGFVVGAVAGTFSGLVFCVLFKLLLILVKGAGKGSGPVLFSSLIKKAEDLAFLENEDALASLEVIGEGGCGKVYKSPLPGHEGRMIAIKKIIQPARDAAELTEEDSRVLNKKMRQVKSEIKTVGEIRHRNLLPLLAHVPRPDCHYLVYEFMKNGSLQDLLIKVSQGTEELDWLARHKIALGVSAGLEYLHFNHMPCIIHRDLKPANILLDDDMEARIADFGLAKAVPDEKTHVTTSNVVGTLGYIAPEYHQTSKFTDKCDIYSFGVILGILVIGKLPSDAFFQHTAEISLVKWMRNGMTSEDPKKVIDPNLMGNGFEEQMLLVLKIACFCTLDDPKQRPNSKEVGNMLSQIKHSRDAE